ncbi:hypothetical protein AAF712_014025 [Marasmius tenuissimus]|uniref:Zn(2)-C6 fungal-type domain-containing protein n=1 Tax=Marasmius tenuissimus TaxID=585030 RepID=A0ABR2ZFM6_9AGAR
MTPGMVEQHSEVSGDTEADNESEADEQNSEDELEDEEERDPNDIVHRRAITATPALKQQFSRLFQQHPERIVTEWKERHRDMKCERCTTSGLPCTNHLGDRKLVCQECNRTSERKCSRVYEFRKEFIIGRMGITEDLWEVLIKVYLEEKGQKTMQKRQEKARRMKEAEDRCRTEEEDELNLGHEDAPRWVTMSTKRDRGTRGKRKRVVVEDEGAISSSCSDSPPAKKGKNKPEVVIDKRTLNKIKRGERKNSKPASRKNAKSSKSSTKTNINRVEPTTNDVPRSVEPANIGDAVRRSKRPRQSTVQAKNAEAEQRKRRRIIEKDITSDSDTHSHDGFIGLPIATAVINTEPASAGATTSAKATSFGNAATTSIVYSLPLLPASVSKSTKTNLPPTPAQKAALVLPDQNQNTINVFDSGVQLPPSLPPPSLIPPELSLSVLKRALEDISSDLRYNRIDVPSAMARFDDVAGRIGKRADLCVVSGTK